MSVLDDLADHEVAPTQTTIRQVTFVIPERQVLLEGEAPPVVKRNGKGQFVVGQSGNLQGRKPSLGPLIRAATAWGEVLVFDVLRRAKGEPRVVKDPVTGSEITQIPTESESQHAVEWLAAHGFEIPAKGVEISGKDGAPIQLQQQGAMDYSKLSADETRAWLAMCRKVSPQTVEGELVEQPALPPQGK